MSDGIDLDSCRRAVIRDCDVESDDDAICLKTSLILGEPRDSEEIVVTGCRMQSPSNGFKIGTETCGGIRNVSVSECTINGRARAGVDAGFLAVAREGEAWPSRP